MKKYTLIEETPGNGSVLLRPAGDGEIGGEVDWKAKGKHGVDDDFYYVVDGVFTAKTDEAVAAIKEERNIEAKKSTKKSEIYAAFELAVKEPVQVTVDGSSIVIDGGYTSIDKLDKAIRFSTQMGFTERTFYDVDETPHVLPIAGSGLTGEAVMLAVGADYETKDAMMRAMIKAVNDAETTVDIDAIVITFEEEAS